MSKYIAEDMVQHTKMVFDTQKEARAFVEAQSYQFGVLYQVYPEEPEEKQPFPGMCECCGRHPAQEDDFICEECTRMMYDQMDSEG